jgi:hypothetical protein
MKQGLTHKVGGEQAIRTMDVISKINNNVGIISGGYTL